MENKFSSILAKMVYRPNPDFREIPIPSPIMLNAYKMNLREMVPNIHLFHLEFFPILPQQTKGQVAKLMPRSFADGDKNENE